MSSDIDQAQISAAIVAALRASPSFGASGAVQRGRFEKPPANTLPFAGLSPPGIVSTQGEEIGSYERTVVYDLQVWGPTRDPSPDVQVTEAEALLDEVLQAIEQDRQSPASALYGVATLDIRSTVVWGGTEGMQANTIGCFLVIELSYPRRTGLQGVSR